jgi:CRP-like cAMP-binding protein
MMNIQTLSAVELFTGLDESALEEVLRAGSPRRVQPGSFFFMQDDAADHLYVLVEGRVKLVQVTLEGQQVILRVIGPGNHFGGLAFVPGTVYPASGEAVEDSLAINWSTGQLSGFIDRYPVMARNAMRMMAGHVREFQDRYRELATEKVDRRLARSLLRLTRQLGKKVGNGIEIAFPLSRQDLAEMSGTTLFTASRALSEWERQGLVQAGREKVIILRPHALMKIAEDLPDPDR